MAARDGFVESSSEDQERIRGWALHFAAAKQAAEYFGRRPRRFSLLFSHPEGAPLPENAKRIHFVRHGQGAHNVWRAQERAAGRAPHAKRGNFGEVPRGLHDPDLTDRGLEEAAATQVLAAAACSPQLLVTSPVRRAVQTCLTVFKAAIDRGVPLLAHELCREQFRGLDPSIYDARRGREALAREFPQVDFQKYVLPETVSLTASVSQSNGGAAADAATQLAADPMWWLCGSPLGACEGGTNETSMMEHAYGFMCWLMSRPEGEVGVATHSLWLLALYYGAFDNPGSNAGGDPHVFYTGELRTVLILERPAPATSGGCLAAYGSALLGSGLTGQEQDEVHPQKRARTVGDRGAVLESLSLGC